MAEYIERKSLIDEFDRLGLGDHSFVERVFSDGVRTIIAGIPAADVVPVAHGEWLLKHIGVGHYWECSVCHTNPCIYVTEHTKFCPNCGARMDGGADNAKAD